MNDQYKRQNPTTGKRKKNFPWDRGDSVQFHLRLVNVAGGNAAYIRWQNDATGANEVSTVARRSIARDFPANLTFYEKATLGSSMTERDWIDYGYKTDTLIVHDNGTDPTLRLAEGIDVQVSQLASVPDFDSLMASNSTIPTSLSTATSNILSQSHEAIATFTASHSPLNITTTPNAVSWNISAMDVDESLATYKLETHQEPKGDKIDIIGLSEMYM